MGLVNDIFKKIADTWYPVGSYYITKTNTNPSSIVGGTWTLKYKKFKQDTVYNNPNNCFTFNSNNVSNGYFYVHYGADCAYAQICYVPKFSVSDTTYVLGTLSTAIGGSWEYNYDIRGYHTGNAYIPMLYLNATTGSTAQLGTMDCITYNATSSYSTGASVKATFPIYFSTTSLYFADNMCSEWHWLRTA